MPPSPRAATPPMSAVPRWSHRDPVEGSNPFAGSDPRHRGWKEATARALAALGRHDQGLAASALISSDPRIYGRQLIDLATARFDTWAQRGLAAVDNDPAQRHYAAWLQAYVANWRRYVAVTCPHVGAALRDELHARLGARAAHWTTVARRSGPARGRRVGPSVGNG